MKPILLLLPATFTAQAATFTGKVVGVSDGDTITVLAAGNKQFKIRLLAIDTPESGQAFGDKAKQALSKKVFGQFVQVHWEKQNAQMEVACLPVESTISPCLPRAY